MTHRNHRTPPGTQWDDPLADITPVESEGGEEI